MGKIETYLGFSVKSGKIIYGIDSIKVNRKKMYLIIVCPTASDNLKKECHYVAGKRQLDIITSPGVLANLVNINNCKVVALSNKSLATAIMDAIGG